MDPRLVPVRAALQEDVARRSGALVGDMPVEPGEQEVAAAIEVTFALVTTSAE